MSHPQQETIELLTSQIALNVSRVSAYLRAHNLPFPSFDVDGPMESSIPSSSSSSSSAETSDIEKARTEIIDATRKLQDLMLGPRDYLQSFTVRCILPFTPFRFSVPFVSGFL